MSTCRETLAQLKDYIIEARAEISARRGFIDSDIVNNTSPIAHYFIDPGLRSAVASTNAMIELINDSEEVICSEEFESGGTSAFLSRYGPNYYQDRYLK